ncbi:hypothetical protein Sjap_004428 [Stephania japonica]|uniref:Uncharacterized protein n=1 Tax=Stephania japonica TaxID=461633 RepID=A0AAP0K4H5_9MAGN
MWAASWQYHNPRHLHGVGQIDSAPVISIIVYRCLLYFHVHTYVARLVLSFTAGSSGLLCDVWADLGRLDNRDRIRVRTGEGVGEATGEMSMSGLGFSPATRHTSIIVVYRCYGFTHWTRHLLLVMIECRIYYD